MNQHRLERRGARGRGWLAPLLIGATMVFAGACDVDELVEVPDPDVVTGGVFQNPENLDAVHAGAVREFARAYGGTQNDEGGQVLFSGLLADEFYHSGTFTTRSEVDARNISTTNSSAVDAFLWLQRARSHNERAAELFAESERAGEEDHAQLLNMAGYTYVMFGENYCSGVPFSTFPLGEDVEFGAPQSTEQIFQRAIDTFEDALALQGSGDLANLARVGIARSLLNLGDYAGAADAVSDVPTVFTWGVPYSESVPAAWNAVWQLNNEERRWSSADNDGENGLPFHSVDDSRVGAEFTGPGFDQDIDHYAQLKYTGPGDPIPLASGVEARLIEAEVALDAGNRDEFFSIHEDLRAIIDLGPLEDTGQSTDELVDLHFEERAYWLWLTSHRLGDLRRLIRQYDRTQDDIYPIGPTPRDIDRGRDVNLPVPFDEENNPEYDPSVCDTEQA